MSRGANCFGGFFVSGAFCFEGFRPRWLFDWRDYGPVAFDRRLFAGTFDLEPYELFILF